MSKKTEIQIIAHIKSDFPDKFGIPRQSGLVNELRSYIIFEPEFRNPDCLRELEGYSHIWLLWQFSANLEAGWSPTVRPPKLGGNKRVGVFASRSPFRPNPIGLSAVKLESIELDTPQGPVLCISGADIMDETPIFDIKPYVPYADCHPEARGGYAVESVSLQVNIPEEELIKLPQELHQGLYSLLAQDPRPGYQHSADRIYGLGFAGFDIRFSVENDTLTVKEIIKK